MDDKMGEGSIDRLDPYHSTNVDIYCIVYARGMNVRDRNEDLVPWFSPGRLVLRIHTCRRYEGVNQLRDFK